MLSQFPSFRSSICCGIMKTHHLHWYIRFTFDRCHRRSAPGTSVKYECDEKKIENFVYGELTNGALVTLPLTGPLRVSDHDDVIKWKHFQRYLPFVWGIHRSPVNSPHKGQWRGALMFSLICAWINGWVNNGETGDFRRHRTHYDVIGIPTLVRHHRYWSSPQSEFVFSVKTELETEMLKHNSTIFEPAIW